ncbi:MAG TPA: carotenoid biosynthesis protein [Candidatus Lokiarchaeia archaeon]|nr:carotenoid biosynthesis protein [Candidatus Lokiarchaeia archaeon]
MAMFTFVSDWVIQDVIILILAMAVVIFIAKNEEHPAIIYLEMFSFCFLYAAVYENFATLPVTVGMPYYAYGRSIIMIFNVPLTVPLIEYLVVYSSLRLARHMDLPNWCKPFFVGFMGMLFDFTMDPVAVQQIFTTAEGTVGRWTWFLLMPSDVNIYGEPVFNFSGWVLLCGYAALFLLLGRQWYEKSGYKTRVGYAYPPLMMLCSLMALVAAPVSQFLLWMEPIFHRGSIGEWIMLGVYFALPTILLSYYWRGKMKSAFSIKSEYPAFLVLVVLHFSDILFAIAGGFWEILWLEFLFTGVQSLIVGMVFFQGKRMKKDLEPPIPVNEKNISPDSSL